MFKYTVIMDTFGDRIKHSRNVDRRITAEQILQLCRILAEQSKNKPFEFENTKYDQCNSKVIQSEDVTSSRSMEQDQCERLFENSEEEQQSAILGDAKANCPAVPLIKTKQVKKDILNKIRNQIFERKRQKLANVQRHVGSVWRPW